MSSYESNGQTPAPPSYKASSTCEEERLAEMNFTYQAMSPSINPLTLAPTQDSSTMLPSYAQSQLDQPEQPPPYH